MINIRYSIFETNSSSVHALVIPKDTKIYIPKTEWEMNYMGDEGSHTLYVDAVNKKYAVSSLEKTQYELRDSIYEMFAHIRKETGKEIYKGVANLRKEN